MLAIGKHTLTDSSNSWYDKTTTYGKSSLINFAINRRTSIKRWLFVLLFVVPANFAGMPPSLTQYPMVLTQDKHHQMYVSFHSVSCFQYLYPTCIPIMWMIPESIYLIGYISSHFQNHGRYFLYWTVIWLSPFFFIHTKWLSHANISNW